MSKNFAAGPFLHVGNETFSFRSAREAIDALRWLVAQGEVDAVFACGWLYEGAPAWASDPDCDWFPDSPSDLIQECQALAVGKGHERYCQSGHHHDFTGEYYDEDELAGMAKAGHLPAANAYTMDGKRVW